MAEGGIAVESTTNILKHSASAGHLNNGYREDEGQELSSPVTAVRLPPLELDVPKRHKHKNKSKSPRTPRQKTDGQLEVGLNDGEEVSPRRQRKKGRKSRPASAENHSENLTNTEPALVPKIELPESELPARSKDAKVEVQVDIEAPPANLLKPDSGRHVSRSHSSNSASKDQQFTDQTLEAPRDSISLQSAHPGTRSVPSLNLGQQSEEIETVDLVSTAVDTPTAIYTKGPPHSILKQTSESDDHVIDMFRAGSRPNSANSSKPSVRIDDNVTYADEVFKPAHPKSARPNSASSRPRSASSSRAKSANRKRPGSASSNRPKSANGSSSNGVANGKVNEQSASRLHQTTQRKISPHTKTSIFTMLFCGLFAGAAALYYSLKSKNALKKGDQVEAAKNSWYSKLFNIIGISTGLFIAIVVVVYYSIDRRPATGV